MSRHSHALILEAAAGAAQELTEAILSFDVFKAVDPLSQAGFLLISKKIATRLARAASSEEAQVVQDVIAELDFDWAAMSAQQTTAALDAISTGITKAYATRVMPKIDSTLVVEAPNVISITKAATVAQQKGKISTALNARDKAAAKAIRTANYNFIRRSTGERSRALSVQARKLVSSGLKQGKKTSAIAETLREAFSKKIPRPDSYWSVVAEAFVGRARATSQVLSYAEMGIETYELVAVIDDVTTDICRFMDGKQFSVQTALQLVDKLDEIEDPEEIIYAHPWVRKGPHPDGGMRLYVPSSDGSTVTIAKIERSGVGKHADWGEYSGAKTDAELATLGIPIPPFHGRCRTVIVAV